MAQTNRTNLGSALEEQKNKLEAAAAGTAAAPVVKTNTDTFKDFMDKHREEIENVLPEQLSIGRLIQVVTQVFKTNPELQECTKSSIIGAVMQMSMLGLQPYLNLAHLVPFFNKKTQKTECQLIIGWRGYMQLVMNTGEFSLIKLHEVYDGDQFEFEYGLDPKLIHKPAKYKDRGEVAAFYAKLYFKNGMQDFMVMYAEDINHIRDTYSAGYKYNQKNSPWTTDYISMCKKTILKQFLKYCPMSTTVIENLSRDEKVFNMLGDQQPIQMIEGNIEDNN